MFRYLDTLEESLEQQCRTTGRMPTADDRSRLGLPRYRFVDTSPLTTTFPCGATVKYVFLGPAASKQRSEAVALTHEGVPAATVDDPDACARKGLCFPNLVRQQIVMCGQELVVTRNAAPYGRNHGVVRSVEHAPQSQCFEPFRLDVALGVAQALGSDTEASEYEVWVAGEGFNTQWHYHLQFRQQRNPIWRYLSERAGAPNAACIEHPSRPIYVESRDCARMIDVLHREISPFRPDRIDADGVGITRPSIGLLMSYDKAVWRAVLVKSWCPRGERLFGKQAGLHEHLGEVILESAEEYERIAATLPATTQTLEAQLRGWCRDRP